MAKFIRYALAAICFAASLGCLALWGWSMTHSHALLSPQFSEFGTERRVVIVESSDGLIEVSFAGSNGYRHSWEFRSVVRKNVDTFATPHRPRTEFFGRRARGFYFPSWFAAIIFALAGVGVLRLGRRFTIRSAIIATTVVAALLGMAVIL